MKKSEEKKNIILFDSQFFGDGYLILTKENEKIDKFMKLTQINEYGFPYLILRAFDRNTINKHEEEFSRVDFTFFKSNNEKLYTIFKEVAVSLNGNPIYTINEENYGKNHFSMEYDENAVKLHIFKDNYGIKNPSNFIDIDLGDDYSNIYYENFYVLYHNLEIASQGSSNEETIVRMLHLK